ncbi:Proton-coupled amino acid transporter-like protein CG1139 [Eumeta japonica]|uniref:Proton-coupled amino acid transporter-like protein CG1139 n=1 Tax=Eumeta variegata TaxID=151549 RepID=A0A4C1Z0M8_EUMVA|nr:Proton-coupled amino acid transporter-like protein CG1139 [Eumeta japonica]
MHCNGFICFRTELACNGSKEDLEPYVPADHRPKESNTSSFGALAHLLKASLGSGVLAMPLAFKNAGIAVGAVGTVVIEYCRRGESSNRTDGGAPRQILFVLIYFRQTALQQRGSKDQQRSPTNIFRRGASRSASLLLFEFQPKLLLPRERRSRSETYTVENAYATALQPCNVRAEEKYGLRLAFDVSLFQVKSSQELCVEIRKPALGYAETCDLVFKYGPKKLRRLAPLARELADWALGTTHMGACCVYIMVIAESFKQPHPDYTLESDPGPVFNVVRCSISDYDSVSAFDFDLLSLTILNYMKPKISDVYGGPEWRVEAYCALTLVPLLPLTQITRLKYLVPFSALANFVWLTSICISLYYCVVDLPDISERELATSASGLPLFISTSLFAMEGVGVVMPLENEMLKPSQFLGCPGVLNTAMAVIVVMYGLVGFLGYYKYGDQVRGSLTLNLPQEEKLAQTAKILVALVLMLSYALIYYVPVDVVWRKLRHRIPQKRHRISISFLRFVGVLVTGNLFLYEFVLDKEKPYLSLVAATELDICYVTFPERNTNLIHTGGWTAKSMMSDGTIFYACLRLKKEGGI